MVHHFVADDSGGEKGTVIKKCGNYGQITGVSDSAPMRIGGIVGFSYYAGMEKIEDCFNIAALSAKTDYTGVGLGGIVGESLSTAPSGSRNIVNCYNIGSLTGECPNLKSGNKTLCVGGVVGKVSNDKRTIISNCYYSDNASAAVGKLWDKVHLTIDATSASQASMQVQSTYKGFDFSNTWVMKTGSIAYPVLRWTLDDNTFCVHEYSSVGGNICTLCGHEFEPELIEFDKTMYAAIENAAVRNQPYAKAGTLVDKLAKGEAVRITHYFINSLGNKWYRIEDGNYIYSERLTTVNLNAKTYTLSFDANGSGVTNIPSSVNVKEGVRYGIPGAVSGKPQRNGYNFIGYSTNKNGKTTEYVPGNSIMLTCNLTLYAVWEKKTVTYSEDISKLLNAIVEQKSSVSKLGDTGVRYWNWWDSKYTNRLDSWCAVYVSYLIDQVSYGFEHNIQINPNSQIKALNDYGCFRAEKGYVPKTGDLVFFEYGENEWNGKSGGAGNVDHVGIVVVKEDGSPWILHGNWGGSKNPPSKVYFHTGKTSTGHGNTLDDCICGYGDVESYVERITN